MMWAPVPSRPDPVPSHPRPVPSRSRSVQSRPVQSRPVQSRPVQSRPVQSSPVQSSPVQSRATTVGDFHNDLDVCWKACYSPATLRWGAGAPNGLLPPRARYRPDGEGERRRGKVRCPRNQCNRILEREGGGG